MWEDFAAALVPLVVAITAWIRAEIANRNLKRYTCGDALTCPDRVPMDHIPGGTTD